MNKADPRVIKTLRQIDEALLTNLKKKSIQKITVDMLCETALINRSTFYKYYQDKYDLLDKYLDRVLSEFREYLNVDFISSTIPEVTAIAHTESFTALLDFVNEHKDQYQIIWRADIERNIYEEMTMTAHNCIYTSMLKNVGSDKKKRAYCDFYAYLFSSNMMALIHWWFMNDGTITLRDARQLMINNMKDGIFVSYKNII